MHLTLVKISGSLLSDKKLLMLFLSELHGYCTNNKSRYIIVHGGGATLSKYCRKHNIQFSFDEHGNRSTSASAMQATQRILAGQLSSDLVHACLTLQIPAIGLSASAGAMVLAQVHSGHSGDSHTGTVLSCDPTLPLLLLEQHYVPVINSVASDGKARALNINADELASELAIAARADALIFISDVEGVMEEQRLLPSMGREKATTLTQSGVIEFGMRVKVLSACKAKESKVEQVCIGNYTKQRDFLELLQGRQGTRIE
ncbi:acetylglutamate kinase-like [Ylistrum balloti]|uniref:acetylglutamate kinase-like n=1 Tax=Ylistrum balloti TaxID=509963 RepID=UPI0029058096|nr:acetylglutamate kinase-like [Ylistrum balloti]